MKDLAGLKCAVFCMKAASFGFPAVLEQPIGTGPYLTSIKMLTTVGENQDNPECF